MGTLTKHDSTKELTHDIAARKTVNKLVCIFGKTEDKNNEEPFEMMARSIKNFDFFFIELISSLTL